jgi:hypothetical protein
MRAERGSRAGGRLFASYQSKEGSARVERRNWFKAVVLIALVLTAAVLLPAVFKQQAGAVPASSEIVSESANLGGLPPRALFPFIDVTGHNILSAHIAVTAATSRCAAGAAPPRKVRVLVGQAGVSLVQVLTAATNTGISTRPGQCVFHVTVTPGVGGVPATVTDIVVRNAARTSLTGINTITASAEVQ